MYTNQINKHARKTIFLALSRTFRQAHLLMILGQSKESATFGESGVVKKIENGHRKHKNKERTKMLEQDWTRSMVVVIDSIPRRQLGLCERILYKQGRREEVDGVEREE